MVVGFLFSSFLSVHIIVQATLASWCPGDNRIELSEFLDERIVYLQKYLDFKVFMIHCSYREAGSC